MGEKDFVKSCDAWTSLLVFARIAVPVTRGCAVLKIHPNAVTVFGMFLAACTVALLVFLPAWALTPYLAVILFFFYWLMDHIDGQLARLTGKTSKVGAVLDMIGDKGGKAGIMLAFACGPLRMQGAMVPALVLVFLHYFSHWYVNYHMGKRFNPDDFVRTDKKYLGFFTSFEETLLMLMVAPLFYQAIAVLALWTVAIGLFLVDSLVFPGGFNRLDDRS